MLVRYSWAMVGEGIYLPRPHAPNFRRARLITGNGFCEDNMEDPGQPCFSVIRARI